MFSKNYFLFFILMVVLILGIGIVSAVSISTVDNSMSVDEFDGQIISSEYSNKIDHVNGQSFLMIDQNNNEVHCQDDVCSNLSKNVEKSDISSNNSEFDDEDDFVDDGDEYYEEVISEEDVIEYIDDIKQSNTENYFKFFTYLTKEKGFVFTTSSAQSVDGYYIYATQKYVGRLYDGDYFTLYPGDKYFISTTERGDYLFDDYYPDAVYFHEDYQFDEFYIGWLKWEEKYHAIFTSTPQSIVSDDNSSVVSNLPYYDLRNVDGKNYVSPVKNQSNGGNCWAFASIAGLESFLLKNESKLFDFSDTFDFSENNLKNVMSSLGRQGHDNVVNNGGNPSMSLAYFIRWSGPISDRLDQYKVDSQGNVISNTVLYDYEHYEELKHVQGVKYIHARNSSKDNDEIKQAILDYGNVITSIYWSHLPFFENGQKYYYWADSNDFGDWHEILIVGWNDTYNRSNFRNMYDNHIPEGDGAFIIKNSWGDDVGDDGFYYVSYYDKTLAYKNDWSIANYVGFSFTCVEERDNYGRNYNYNPLGVTFWSNFNDTNITYYNQWIAIDDENLEAVGIYIDNPANYTIKVYVENKIIETATRSDQLMYAGFHTIKLNDSVNIKVGETFRIEVSLISDYFIHMPIEARVKILEEDKLIYTKSHSNRGESRYYNGSNVYDINDLYLGANLCINAYTEFKEYILTKIISNDLTITKGDNKNVIAQILTITGSPVVNSEVTFRVNGQNYFVKTDSKGQAVLKFNQYVGVHNIKIHYNGNRLYSSSDKSIKLIVKPKLDDPKLVVGNYYVGTKKIIISGVSSLSGEKVVLYVGSSKYVSKFNRAGNVVKNFKKGINSRVTIKAIFGGNNYFKSSTAVGYVKTLVKTVTGFKSNHKHTDKITVRLKGCKATLNSKVTVKANGKTGSIKFTKGSSVLHLDKWSLKKGKNYVFNFIYNDKDDHKYEVKAESRKIKIIS